HPELFTLSLHDALPIWRNWSKPTEKPGFLEKPGFSTRRNEEGIPHGRRGDDRGHAVAGLGRRPGAGVRPGLPEPDGVGRVRGDRAGGGRPRPPRAGRLRRRQALAVQPAGHLLPAVRAALAPARGAELPRPGARAWLRAGGGGRHARPLLRPARPVTVPADAGEAEGQAAGLRPRLAGGVRGLRLLRHRAALALGGVLL